MRSHEQIARDIQRIPYLDTFGTKKEIKYLPEILYDDEEILSLTSGFLDGNTWLIVLTPKRIIFLDKGMIYGLKQREIPLDHVNSVIHKIGLLLGSITIQDGASAIKIDNIQKTTILPFVNALSKATEELKNKIHSLNNSNHIPSISTADEIMKYRKLADDGVITEEEFLQKKKQLLGI